MSIDLSPLQPAAVIDVDGLPLGTCIQSGRARLAVTVTRSPRAPERQVNLGADGACIDVDNSSSDVSHGLKGAVHVLRENGAGEPISDRVVNLDRLLYRAHLNSGSRGPKNLLLGNAHLRLHPIKDCRFVKETFGTRSLGVNPSTN